MMKKLVPILIMLGFIAFTMNSFAANPVYVDDDYTSGGGNDGHTWGVDAFDNIQDGIDNVDNGGTVNVAAGTYNENVEIDVPDITLQSVDGRDNTIITPPTIGLETPGISVLKNMGTVTVDGFTADGFRNGIIQGMSKSEGTAYIVKNCKVIPENNDTDPYLRNGIQVSGDNSQVIGNYVIGAALTSTWASSGIGVVNASNVLVQDNTVNTASADIGISVLNYSVALVNNITIKENTVIGATHGIRLNGKNSENWKSISNVQIEDNMIKESPDWAGIYLIWTYAEDVTIIGNEIVDHYYFGIVGHNAEIDGLFIESNNVSGNGFAGIYFYNTVDLLNDIIINSNDLSNNTTYGLGENTSSSISIDATCNWWGDEDLCKIAPKISGNVDFIPWLTNGTDNEPGTTGFQPVPNSCDGSGGLLVTNLTTGEYFCSIQDAIDAADQGDVIEAGDGDYNEDVTINKDGLTVRAENPPTNTSVINGQVTISADNIIFEKFKVVPGSVSGHEAAILISSSNVTVQKCIIDGMTGDGTGSIKGIHIYNGSTPYKSGYHILSNTIKNIDNQGTTSYGGSSGMMIQGVIEDIEIKNNTIVDMHSKGWAYGIEITPTSSAPTNPPKNVEIRNNDVSKVNDGSAYTLGSGSAPYPGACLSIDAASSTPADPREVTVKHNKFVNTPSSYGAINKNTDYILDAENNWWGDASGPEFDGLNRIDYRQNNGPDIDEPIVDGGCGSKINNNVDFSPYYTDMGMTTLQNIQVNMYNTSGCVFNGSSVATSHGTNTNKDPRQAHFALQNAVNCAYDGDIVEIVGGLTDETSSSPGYKEIVVHDGITVLSVGDEYIIDSGSPPIWSWSDIQMTFRNCVLRLVNDDRWIRIHGDGDIICVDCKFYADQDFSGWSSQNMFVPQGFANCEYLKRRYLDGCQPNNGDYSDIWGPDFDDDPERPAPGNGCFHFNVPRCAPFQNDLVLHLDPTGLHQLDGQPIEIWKDNTKITDATNSAHPENATQTDNAKKPNMSRAYTSGGIMAFPAVDFNVDYRQRYYGQSDIMNSEYSKEITTDETSKWEPDHPHKNLFVVFQVSDLIDEAGEGTYYTDGRQCIVEMGGPLSGYNAYIHQSKIVIGMWNRYQRQFLMYDPDDNNNPLYPLTAGYVYLLHLEYNGDTKQFRGVVNCAGDNNNAHPPGYVDAGSEIVVSFDGLTKDNTSGSPDLTGIGGAARTHYHDYNTGETHSDHFDGKIGDVMLYNKHFETKSDMDKVYQFLNYRYKDFDWVQGFQPYGPFYYDGSSRPKDSDDWKVFTFTDHDRSDVQVSEAYPNPFTTTTTLGILMTTNSRVKVELFDELGNKVTTAFEGSLGEGFNPVEIDGTGLTSGMYMYRVTGDGFVKTGKVVLSK